LHLIPYLSVEVTAYILNEPQSLESFIDNSPKLAFRIIFGVVSILSWFIYNITSYKLVNSHRKGLEDEFSSLETSISLGWLLFVVIFYSTFCIISFAMGVYVISTRTLMLMPNIFVYATMLLLVYILGYYGLMQKDIYSRIIPEEVPEKHKKSVLSASARKNLKKKILDYFENENPYLNPELNMDMLSAHLGIPKHRITEVLNTEIGKNFFQFVNSYRIEAVKAKLSEKSNPYSIEAIGYECGFNSKSSFFTVFKKLTGQTPYQYKQSIP
jgi:AraC-like DNA-binding protein